MVGASDALEELQSAGDKPSMDNFENVAEELKIFGNERKFYLMHMMSPFLTAAQDYLTFSSTVRIAMSRVITTTRLQQHSLRA